MKKIFAIIAIMVAMTTTSTAAVKNPYEGKKDTKTEYVVYAEGRGRTKEAAFQNAEQRCRQQMAHKVESQIRTITKTYNENYMVSGKRRPVMEDNSVDRTLTIATSHVVLRGYNMIRSKRFSGNDRRGYTVFVMMSYPKEEFKKDNKNFKLTFAVFIENKAREA